MAVADDAQFVSCLDEKSKEKARKELHELNDKDRELAVQTFRKWVCDQDWMRTPTDFEFLLRFLRVRKFSQLEARKTLEKYWKCKEHLPTIYRDMDPADPDLQAIIRYGFAFGHKKTDKEGRRLLICRAGCVSLEKLKEIGMHNWYKVLALVQEWIMFDENTQVNGVRNIVDLTDMGFQLYLAYASVDEIKSLVTFMQKCLPIRLKAIFYYNEPSFMDVFLAFVRPFMTDKIHDRSLQTPDRSYIRLIRIRSLGPLHYELKKFDCKYMFSVTQYTTQHILSSKTCVVGSNLATLYKYVDKSLLPNEYLPDDYTGPRVGSVQKVIDEMIEDMNTPKFREYIRAVSSNKYGMDIKKRADMEQEPAASFRKLNVD